MNTASFRSGVWLLSLASLLAFLSGGTSASAEEPAPAAKCEVQAVKDLDYYEGPDADPKKHKLDLYLPKGRKDFPVLFFVHGGGWIHGDRNFFGVYGTFATRLAELGIGAVVISYRLSPQVMHPGHIKDVARAFTWTYKNIAKHGGRADRIFLCGHSAGGHLVSLLATDEQYLKAEGLDVRCIRGAIPLSGVYKIPDGLFANVFGRDEQMRRLASPICHARADLPPFLIIYAESDLPTCDRMSCDFCKALQECNCRAETLEVKDRNHATIILDAIIEGDPLQKTILTFVQRHLE